MEVKLKCGSVRRRIVSGKSTLQMGGHKFIILKQQVLCIDLYICYGRFNCKCHLLRYGSSDHAKHNSSTLHQENWEGGEGSNGKCCTTGLGVYSPWFTPVHIQEVLSSQEYFKCTRALLSTAILNYYKGMWLYREQKVVILVLHPASYQKEVVMQSEVFKIYLRHSRKAYYKLARF